jgi:hypothetical protein
MNEQILRMLKDNIRKAEADLSNWRIELSKRANAYNEATKIVELLVQQVELLQDQLLTVQDE